MKRIQTSCKIELRILSLTSVKGPWNYYFGFVSRGIKKATYELHAHFARSSQTKIALVDIQKEWLQARRESITTWHPARACVKPNENHVAFRGNAKDGYVVLYAGSHNVSTVLWYTTHNNRGLLRKNMLFSAAMYMWDVVAKKMRHKTHCDKVMTSGYTWTRLWAKLS